MSVASSTATDVTTYEAVWREYQRESQKVLVVALKHLSRFKFGIWSAENPGWVHITGSLRIECTIHLPFPVSSVRVYDVKSTDMSRNIVPHLRRPDLELNAELYPNTTSAWNGQFEESKLYIEGNQPELQYLEVSDIQEIIARCKRAKLRYEAVRDTEEAIRLDHQQAIDQAVEAIRIAKKKRKSENASQKRQPPTKREA